MGLLDFLRAVLALSVTLGLIGLAAVGLRRYAPGLLGRMQARQGRKRRMQVIETLVLDPARRLVLVRVGEEERLVLLGEGKELSRPAAEAAAATSAPASASPPILRGSTR
jgi:flagellar protein FliO/FliZ